MFFIPKLAVFLADSFCGIRAPFPLVESIVGRNSFANFGGSPRPLRKNSHIVFPSLRHIQALAGETVVSAKFPRPGEGGQGGAGSFHIRHREDFDRCMIFFEEMKTSPDLSI